MTDYLCNLVVPGFPKCGTSSFHEYLNQHPQICMSRKKEPHYFSRTINWERGPGYHNALFMNSGERYLYYGESSTTYCVWEESIERIKSSLKDPKIIFMLKDPLKRILSHYRWLYKLGLEEDPFFRAIEKAGCSYHPDDDIKGNFKSYLRFSSYSKYVPLWISAFGKSNVFLVSAENLESHPLSTMNSCFSFLGLHELKEIKEVNKNVTSTIKIERSRVDMSFVKIGVFAGMAKVMKKSFLAKSLYRKIFVAETAIPDPDINESDVKHVSILLEDDIYYYNKLFL